MKKAAEFFLCSIVAFFCSPVVLASDNLQTILDTIKSGSTVYVNSGVFTTDVGYRLNDKKNITLVFKDGCEIFCTEKNANVFDISDCDNIRIINGKFKHQVFEDDICLGVVFMIGASNNIFLSNCDINGSGSRGIQTNLVKNLMVENCNIHGNSTAAFLFYNDCTNFKLLQNVYAENGESGDVKFDLKKEEYELDRIADSEIEERQFTSLEKMVFNSIQNSYDSIFQKMGSEQIMVLYDYKLDPNHIEIKDGLYYYSRKWEDPDLMGCKSQTLLSVKDGVARIFSFEFCDATGGGWSYGFGRIEENKIRATFYSAHIEDINADPMGVDTSMCTIVFLSDLQTIEITSTVFGDEESVTKESLGELKYSFSGGVKNFRELPSTDSKILSKVDVAKSDIQLLEIGIPEMIGSSYDSWYKVKINDTVGWLFGGLDID